MENSEGNMSSVAESPDEMALQSQYSLRWDNHQTHILQALQALLNAEILFDVTLVCSETSISAHKVVLGACSPFFEKIFAEHPCKHPVILLTDFPGREVAALIDFMYRGEVRVGREDLSSFMRAAESLQIRGLAFCEPRLAGPPATTPTTDLKGEPSTPEGTRHGTPEEDDNVSESTAPASRDIFPRDHRLPHMSHLNISLRELRDSCGSPLMPRRKQARPRSRSGEWFPNDPQSQLHGHRPWEDTPHNRFHLYQQGDSPMTPRRSVAIFPMDGVTPLGGAAGLFPHGALNRGSALFGTMDGPRRWSDHGRGLTLSRPKGQHSAPTGGRRRSWTNAALTEALQRVWNNEMRTSQASRFFGIPYNSLLMYVNGRYGKSLKFEQLRRNCTGATTGEVMNSLNNNVTAAVQPPQMLHPLSGMPHPGDGNPFPHHPLLGGNLPQGFFQDFGAAFPVPVSMVHLLPPSEQTAYEPPNPTVGGNCGNSGTRSECTTRSRFPSSMAPNHEGIPQSSAKWS